MTNFDRTEYRRVVRRLAGDVDARVEDGMSVRAALYRSVGECIVDLWNHDTSLRVCELSEKDPEIEIVNKIITGDETDTHADHELFVRAMAFSVLSQDVREAFENTVTVNAETMDPGALQE